MYGWGCTNRIVCEAINATVTEKACVCQLLNMGHGHSERHTGEQLPYKSLTFEMLRWARRPHRHSMGEQRSDSGRGSGWHRGDVTPPPICLAGKASRETPAGASRQVPRRFSFLRPRSRQNGVVWRRPETHKEFNHKLLLYVVALTHMVPLLSARLLIHPFRLMSYTTKKIDALGYYGPCKREKIPALWQVAIKS